MDWIVEDTAWSTHDLRNYRYEERHTLVIRKVKRDGVSEAASFQILLVLMNNRRLVGSYCLLGGTGTIGSRK